MATLKQAKDFWIHEVWALLSPEGDYLVGPTLDDDGAHSFLAFGSRAEAEQGAQFQNEHYFDDDDGKCIPVRIA
ncbi:MAG: hypothetical protein JRH08_18530 [Deltaproteobacteria bacterium]|nr:hypothetical protein [Deltaproteobacteria bacterium]